MDIGPSVEMILSCTAKVQNGCSPVAVDKAWQVCLFLTKTFIYVYYQNLSNAFSF